MYVRVYITYVRMYVRMYVCIYVCMHVCMYVNVVPKLSNSAVTYKFIHLYTANLHM